MYVKKICIRCVGKVLDFVGLKKIVKKAIKEHKKKKFENEIRFTVKSKSNGEKAIERSLKKVVLPENYKGQKIILILGSIVGDRRECSYFNTISDLLKEKGYGLILITEAVLADNKLINQLVFPVFKAPAILGKNLYINNIEINNPLESEDDYLKWGIDNLVKRHSDMTLEYASQIAYYTKSFYTKLFNLLNPVKILIWNNLYAVHHIIDEIAEENNLSPLYMEFGSIPGTMALDQMGQMGESEVAREYNSFKEKPILEKEIERAQIVWEYLKISRLNRKDQGTPPEVLEQIIKMKDEKPIIFFAGQNDFESGLQPYTERTRNWHSPLFKTSLEALRYISEICKKNKWNIIYKPHPLMVSLGSEQKDCPDNVFYVETADINDLIDLSDVTVTILSQTGYVSTIREKATLMLGYNQLRGKDCTYEAFDYESIESKLKEAIKNGFTKMQKNAFKKHLAQVLNYYLFDDLQSTHIRYGQEPEQFVSLITGKRLD